MLVTTIQHVNFFCEEGKNQGKKDNFLIDILFHLWILHSFQSTLPLSFESDSTGKTQELSESTNFVRATTRKEEEQNAKKKKKEGRRIEERS